MRHKNSGRLLCVTERYKVFYRKGSLIVEDMLDNSGKIQKKRIGSILEHIGIISRLQRLEPRCAVFVDYDTVLISHNGRILRYSISTNQLEIEHFYASGMKNPLSFCVCSFENDEETVYYGEYMQDTGGRPVAIYSRKKGVWGKVFEFEADTIKHIHNVVYDKKKDCFYIATGDDDMESGIWVANRAFTSVKEICRGKQMYRSCVLFPTEYGLIYATDTPLHKNCVYKLFYEGDSAVKAKVEEVCGLPGPCIFGAKIGDKLYFSTSVEPDSRLSKWRYLFTYKRGEGIDDNCSHVISINPKDEVLEIFKREKDILPMGMFQFGNILFPYNETEECYITLQALKNGHNKTVRLS